MKLLVVDSFGSFSLVPYIKERIGVDELFSMANVNDKTWNIFRDVNPDVVFIDFCNENAVYITERIKELPKKPKIIIRLHGYEAQSWFMREVKWETVSKLIVVSPKFEDIVKDKGLVPQEIVQLVYNGIDLNKFRLQEFTKESEARIAWMGYINKKKGPTLLRTIIASCPQNLFHVAGKFQDEQVRLYFDHLHLYNVSFDGWVKTEEFLLGKRYILSTSVTESFGMSIGEGMAMGLTPLVHNWPGAEYLWPQRCIFNTIDEMKKIEPLEPIECRKWVKDLYSMDKCITTIMGLIYGD